LRVQKYNIIESGDKIMDENSKLEMYLKEEVFQYLSRRDNSDSFPELDLTNIFKLKCPSPIELKIGADRTIKHRNDSCALQKK
jgi:hypothetical protein